ncbi:MAG: hypothetical protein L0387_01450 [Acidobacteria bacterium]|nr:hypothetical protein [Acidobacteriota bacterium]MCI0620336.1 hypothetical protein [Acidobacteriota bacterium]MCI0723181.1 hypothetical protein [Acidobacteriota bacterium]
MTAKEAVLQMIQDLPAEATTEDIMVRLYFRLQVEAGLAQLDEGQWISHEDVEKRMAQWLEP